MNKSDLSPEDLAEVEHNERIEAVCRWAFTVFCGIVVVGWLVWPWLT